MNENIFSLTKREQRAIIGIVLLLLLGTLVMHFRSLRQPIPIAKPAASPNVAPSAPDENE